MATRPAPWEFNPPPMFFDHIRDVVFRGRVAQYYCYDCLVYLVSTYGADNPVLQEALDIMQRYMKNPVKEAEVMQKAHFDFRFAFFPGHEGQHPESFYTGNYFKYQIICIILLILSSGWETYPQNWAAGVKQRMANICDSATLEEFEARALAQYGK